MNISKILKRIKKVPKCTGCKFLYSEGVGYSNDQRTVTRLSCAMNRQENLPSEFELTDSVHVASKTLMACDLYSPGHHVSLDVAGHEGPSLYSSDSEQIEAIANHSRRPKEGQPQSWALANLIRVQVGS